MSECSQWPQVELADVVKPRKQKAGPASVGDVPFLGLEHVEAHTARIVDLGRASEMKSAVAVFEAGDVLYGRLRPYLNKVVKPDFGGAASAEFIVLPGNSRVDAGFLQRLLMQRAFVEFASHINQGDRPRVDFEQIGRFRFRLPSLAQQRQIVAKLDSLFDRSKSAREELVRIPRLVDRYKQAVLAAAFRGDLTAEWKEKEVCKPVGGDPTRIDPRVGELFTLPSRWACQVSRRSPMLPGGLLKTPSGALLNFKCPISASQMSMQMSFA